MVKNFWLWALALGAIAVDRLSKSWAEGTLLPGESLALWPGVLDLTLIKNTGAAFSLFAGGGDWLKWVSLLVSLALVAYGLFGRPLGPWEQFGFGLLLGGAIGNGFDRFLYGEVTDFLEIRFIQFPVFNGADIAINLGLACLIFAALRGEERVQSGSTTDTAGSPPGPTDRTP